jgi:hypothetical protein
MKAFASLHHRLSELVQSLDEVNLLVDGKVCEPRASRPLRGEYFIYE